MGVVADFKSVDGLLDNPQTTVDRGRYIAQIAIPCQDLDEAARWYTRITEGCFIIFPIPEAPGPGLPHRPAHRCRAGVPASVLGR